MKQYLILVLNNLESFRDLLENIRNSLPFQTWIFTGDELKSDKVKDILAPGRMHDIFIGIDYDYHETIQAELKEYLQSFFDAPFTNMLYFYRNTEDYRAALSGNKVENAFILFENYDLEKITLYFYMYLTDLFSKATISHRLSDYIYNSFKSVVYSELLKLKKQEVDRLNQELERRNRIDPLTNLFNRRALFEFLDRERNRAIRNLLKIGAYDLIKDNPHYIEKERRQNFSQEYIEGNLIIFSIMMIDLDKFKFINDTYGHLVGDNVLKYFGEIFRKNGVLREQDIVGRFGGEEFIVILPGTNAKNALEPARRLSKELENYTFKSHEQKEFKVTMSIGISEYKPADKTGDDIIQRADKALYYAKQQGRNTVIIYDENLIES